MKKRRKYKTILFAVALLLGALLLAYSKHEPKTTQRQIAQHPVREYKTFHGLVTPFELADLWVLDNAGSRDLETLLVFLNARAGGIHYEYRRYAKKHKVYGDIMFGLYMRINADGVFDSTAVSFTESNNADLSNAIATYVKQNFRYKKSGGSTELILPIRIKSLNDK